MYSPAALYLSGTFEPNVWVDIGATLERKIEALVLPREPARRDRRLVPRLPARDGAIDAGRAAGVQYAEAFRRIALG